MIRSISNIISPDTDCTEDKLPHHTKHYYLVIGVYDKSVFYNLSPSTIDSNQSHLHHMFQQITHNSIKPAIWLATRGKEQPLSFMRLNYKTCLSLKRSQ